jgi:DNA primase
VVAELSNDFREQVRSRTDLVALIGESVTLKNVGGGREYVGLCPFHDDHNPSLHVYPDRQTFRCWVCNTGGDCFTFVMEEAKVGFREALEMLARRAGLTVPRRFASRGDGPSEQDRSQIFEALLWAQNLFHDALLANNPPAERARDYLLRQRRFTPDTIRRFRLGYHPNDWSWLQEQARGKFTPEVLEAARLIGKRPNGPGYYDHFVDRVLFPIWNERGQPVAFGGRVLPGGDDSHGKYWNSPESSVFHKSRLVYALSHAREGIRQEGSAIVTEGYTDCIALHQAGLTHAVATLGTALTEQQVATLKRFTPKVVLVYDGDEAGQRAAERAVERFLAQDLDLRILTLPDGLDPDEFLTARGAEALRELINRAPEAWDYKFAAVRRRHGTDSLAGRQRILEEMLSLLAVVPRMSENVREGMLLGSLAMRLGVAEQQVRDRYRQLRGGRAPRPADRNPAESRQSQVEIARLMNGQATPADRLELAVMEVLCVDPAQGRFLQSELTPDAFENQALRRLYEIGIQFAKAPEPPSFEHLLGAIEHPELKRLVVWIDEQAQAKGVPDQLRESQADDGCPLLLRRSIDSLKWRREEQSHLQVVVALTAASDGPRGLDAEAERLLRQASEFHQRRATRKATP